MRTLITFEPKAAYVEVLPDFGGIRALVIRNDDERDAIYVETTDELLTQIHEAIGKHLAAKAEGKEKAAVK